MAANDAVALAAGAAAWALAVPVVKLVGPAVATGGPRARIATVLLALGISAVTTPLLSRLLGWTRREQRVRGIALALGAAQTIDGAIHIFSPSFYSTNGAAALGSAGAIFSAAGFLGILSVYT